MRLLIAVLAALALMIGSAYAAPVLAAASASGYSLSLDNQQQPNGQFDVNIDVNKGVAGGGAWYTNPMWIAIGVIALVVIIALVVMAGRGGGTTVVKE